MLFFKQVILLNFCLKKRCQVDNRKHGTILLYNLLEIEIKTLQLKQRSVVNE